MADLTKTIEIIFAGVNNTSQSLETIGKGLNDLESNVGDLTGPLAELSASILTAEASILAAGAAMVGVAVNEAGQFGDSVTEIGTLFNGTTEQVDALSGQILEFSRGSVSSIEAINSAVYTAISTGTDWTESVQLVAEAEKLATAGRADLNEVTKLLTGSLNAYGDGTLQAADYSDALFVAVQKGQTTIPELAASLGQVTGIASAAQVPFDDLVGALAALTVTTGTTAESSTKLKALLSELLKPSSDLSTALGGVTLAGDGLDGVMAKLLQVTGGSAEEMTKLFGSVEAVQAALALANDKSGVYADTLQAMADRTGVVVAATEAMADNFENINQNLLNNIKATLIEFGGPLLDGYRDVALALGSIFQGVSISLDAGAFDAVYGAFDALGASLAETLRGIADALPAALEQVDFSGLLDALDELQTSFGNIFGDLDLTQPDDLARAIQFLVDGFESLTRVSAGIVDGLKPFIQLLGDIIDSVNNAEGGTKALVGQILGFAQGLDGTLVPALGIAGDGLGAVANLVLTLSGAKYLGATTAGFGGLGASVSALAGALSFYGPAALVTALGLTVYAFSDFYDSVQRTNELIAENKRNTENWIQAFKETSTWEEAVVRANELGESVSHLNEEFLNSFGVTADAVAQYGSVEKAQQALIDQYGSLEEAEAAQRAALEGTVDATEQKLDADQRLYQEHLKTIQATQDVARNYDDIVAAVSESTRLTDLQAQSTEDLAEAYQLMSLEQRAALSTEERALYVAAVEKSFEATDQATDSTKELTKAEIEAKLTAKELAEIRLEEMKAVQDYQLALEELASQERLKALEFAFELNLAALESDTEKAVAIIDTINTAIESTGQLISDLFGYLTNDDLSFSQMWAIEEQIELENKRRQEALDLQKQLTEALIDQMEARTEALERGDGLITIQADGLEPEIEAFMWKIIEKIHIKAVGDQSQFLLGI